AAGTLDVAARLADDMSGSSARQEAAALTARALVLAGGQRFEEAADAFDGAATRWKAQGNVVEEALASLGAAESCSALGRDAPAAGRAETAGKRFRLLGAEGLGARAAQLRG